MTAVKKMRGDEAALKQAHMLIGGQWVDSASGEVLEVEDPAHRLPIAVVPRGRAEDVARAVRAAADAFPAWSRTVPRDRGRLIARIADALEARLEELARIIALETGNALRTRTLPERFRGGGDHHDQHRRARGYDRKPAQYRQRGEAFALRLRVRHGFGLVQLSAHHIFQRCTCRMRAPIRRLTRPGRCRSTATWNR